MNKHSKNRFHTPTCRELADNASRHLHEMNVGFGSPLMPSSTIAQSTPPRLFLKPKRIPEYNDWQLKSFSTSTNGQPRGQSSARQNNRVKQVSRRSLSLRRTAVLNSANESASYRSQHLNQYQNMTREYLMKSDSESDFSNSETEEVLRSKHQSRMKKKALSQTYDKENLSPLPVSKTNTSPNGLKSAKRSSLSPGSQSTVLCPPTRTFLVPKIKEPKANVPVLLPRHTSLRSVVPKKRLQTEEEDYFPALPTQILNHTPKPPVIRPDKYQSPIESNEDKSIVEALEKPSNSLNETTPRQFLVAPEPGAARSVTSINSLLSLPSQILKHTPVNHASSSAYSSASPCLSKARVKTVWTLVDEMKLIRTGGVLRDTSALEPISQVRVVPLCQRLRNGVDVERNGTLLKTPARSASMPHNLSVSKHRNRRCKDQTNVTDILPISSSTLSPAGGREDVNVDSKEEKKMKRRRKQEQCEWTFVDVKKSERRFSQPIGAYRGGEAKHAFSSVGTVFAKPSLLTRAQTLMKLKFPGSRKVVGRGDPKHI